MSVGFKCIKDKYGKFDVDMDLGDIGIVEDDGLFCQTVEAVLQTNKGEWEFDTDEGVDFRKILVKNPNEDVIKNEVKQAVYGIDTGLELTDFKYHLNRETRKAVVDIKIRAAGGKELEISGSI